MQFGRGSGAHSAKPMVASVFKSLAGWKNPILTNFEFDNLYFDCPSYSEDKATQAFDFFKNDTTYLQQLQLRDSLTLARKLGLDSLQTQGIVIPDSLGIPIPNDTIVRVRDRIL